MAYLADTHIAVWLWDEPERISRQHTDILASDATIFLSIASIWEISIKAALGKLNIPMRLADQAEADGFRLLGISAAHAEAVRHMPLHHGDPFDRMLIVQAQAEGLTILTEDRKFAAYDVALI